MNSGGSYKKDKKTGKAKLVERTQDHPEGNRPRNKDGRPLNVQTDKPNTAATVAEEKNRGA